MKHLTVKQVQEFVDGSADYMAQATCTNHLATCDRCRREVDLQKAILSSARQAGYVMPSRSFTRRVMAHIVPSRARRTAEWVLNNMGTMFGMMAILGVTGSVIVGSKGEEGVRLSMPTMDLSAENEMMTGLWKNFSDAVGNTLGFLSLPPISSEGNLVLIMTSAIALLVLDRFLRSRLKVPVR